jgi:anti-sigma regulatory factor (Ser/Thr protein kinase)
MKDLLGKSIHIRILSLSVHLPAVRGALEKVCAAMGFDANAVGEIILSVDEALTNIIRHAYHGEADKPIEIEIVVSCEGGCEALSVRIRDYGTAADPATIKSRDLADVRPGGLGVHIMTHCMDHVEYTHPEGGGTLLIMRKNLPAAIEAKQDG